MQSFALKGNLSLDLNPITFFRRSDDDELLYQLLMKLTYTFLLALFLLIFFSAKNGSAQKTDGTVNSLIKADKNFEELIAKKGLNQAYLNIATKYGVVFKPNPQNIIDYFGKLEPVDFQVERKPDLAMISKDGYFGFTAGLYKKTSTKPSYGHYLSVWKAAENRKWQLVLDADIPHQKPQADAEIRFIDPSNYHYPKLLGPKKVKMRQDIVFSTDELFGIALKNGGNKNFSEYYAKDVTLYFPGEYPLIGKEAAIKFIDKKNQHVVSNPTFVDRAFSGDLAFTNGKARFGSREFDYVRIWRIGEDMKWYVLVDMYVE